MKMNESTSFRAVLSYLPEKMRGLMSGLQEKELEFLTEVRLRAGGPVYFVYPNKVRYLQKNGGLSAKYTDEAYFVGALSVKETVDRLCHFSIHSCKKQLEEGFFVVENGVRVGVSGAYSSADSPKLYEFASLNFRIPRCVKGCADKLFTETFDENIIICGGVNSGKTTILRELCRLTGNIRKTVLIDERNEVACMLGGEPQNDIGIMTDVIVNLSRSGGIMSAVRTLSPDVVFCDEISSMADSEAIMKGIGCGVKFVVTAHGKNYSDFMKRNDIAFLVNSGLYDSIVFLEGASAPSKIREIKRLGNVH
jgi:stage III sporulation protein AA